MSKEPYFKILLDNAEDEVKHLKRALARVEKQLIRQEKIDDMNRHQTKWAMTQLEEARLLAEQANQAKTDFLANMSHEIRTPLNIVLGMGELLAGTELDNAQKRYLQSLRFSGEHLLKLIDDILEFSHIESGSVDVELRPFDLKAMLVGVEAMGAHLAAEKGISFTLECGPSVFMNRTGDSGKIKQVLLNLLGNAIKFTDKGSITLSVTDLYDYSEGSVLFTMSDTGIGIPADKQRVIFDRFMQIEQGHLKNQTGVGLGLAISHRLIRAMGGQISIESEEGMGSSFSVKLPLPKTVGDDASGDRPRIEHEHRYDFSGLHLLVVDDIQLNFEMITNFVKNHDITCAYADNGRNAIEKFEADNSYDAILMDIRMPVMGGIEAVKHIRSIEKRKNLAAVPIIAMTAHVFAEQERDYLEAGFNAVFIKPFSRSDLLGVLSRQVPDLSGDHSRQANNKQGDSSSGPLAAVIPQVLASIIEGIDEIRQAIAANDLKALASVSHSMKGLAGFYELTDIYNLLEHIERSAEKREMRTARALLEALSCHVYELKNKDLESLTRLAN